jgi:hypothetical protein
MFLNYISNLICVYFVYGIHTKQNWRTTFAKNFSVQPFSQVLLTALDLNSVGEEIFISPSSNGVSKIIMKFGGSSLASAERIIYVTK